MVKNMNCRPKIDRLNYDRLIIYPEMGKIKFKKDKTSRWFQMCKSVIDVSFIDLHIWDEITFMVEKISSYVEYSIKNEDLILTTIFWMCSKMVTENSIILLPSIPLHEILKKDRDLCSFLNFRLHEIKSLD